MILLEERLEDAPLMTFRRRSEVCPSEVTPVKISNLTKAQDLYIHY